MEALGGRGAVPGSDDDGQGGPEAGGGPTLTGEGYEEMPMLGVDTLDNSASYVMQQDSKVDAMPYNESSIISNEYGQ